MIVSQPQRIARTIAVKTERREPALIQLPAYTRPTLGQSAAQDLSVGQAHPGIVAARAARQAKAVPQAANEVEHSQGSAWVEPRWLGA